MTDTAAAYDTSNIFAKILRGEIPAHKVYEDPDIVAFMDVMPQAPGHTLVVPKVASRNLLDADPAVLAKILPVAQKVARAVKSAFGADGISVIQYNERAGGQSVFHLHFHVIPRHEGISLKPHTGGMESPEVLALAAQKIKAALDA
jgi:histidine triad (HIT) family protein